MPQEVAGQRYAQALFELAVERGELEPWGEQLQFASQVLQDEEFRAFLSHAEVPLETKTGAVGAVLQDLDPLVKNLVSLLVSRRAADSLGAVHQNYVRLLDAHLGRQRVGATSAVPLDAGELERVKAFAANLTGKEVVVSAEVDESILGGIIIQIGDQLLDGSAGTRLEEMRRQIRTGIVQSGS